MVAERLEGWLTILSKCLHIRNKLQTETCRGELTYFEIIFISAFSRGRRRMAQPALRSVFKRKET